MKCGDCAAGWDNDGEKGCKGSVVSAVGLVGLVAFGVRSFRRLIMIRVNY